MKTVFQYLILLMFSLRGFAAELNAIDAPTKHVLSFIENKGQVWDFEGKPQPQVKFACEQGGMTLFFLPTGVAYQFSKTHYPQEYLESLRQKPKHKFDRTRVSSGFKVETFRMDMSLIGANPNARITTEGKSSDYINYYTRNTFDVHSYSKIIYHDVYPGIDWVIYTLRDNIKYDFIVHPGADPGLIQMQYQHHEDLFLNKDGGFTVKNSLGTVSEQKPVSMQGDTKISTNFSLKENIVSFILGEFDRNKTLIIDPLLVWGTYYGGNDWDIGWSCTTDATGNVYLVGRTESALNIASAGHQNSLGGQSDAFLVKFNSSGVRQWATYYGGQGNYPDEGTSCAVDASGNVYLAGTTESPSGIASGGFQSSLGGANDAFLVKFSSAGTRIWGTYYGGSDYDHGNSCKLDGSGNVYLAGEAASANNIASGGHQNTLGGFSDAFLVKFDPSGARLWASYYGGTDTDYAYSCAVSSTGDVYLAGMTQSTVGLGSGGFQNAYGGGDDAFLAKFNASGVRQWGTYYGGYGNDNAFECTTDGLGNVFIAGSTNSPSNLSATGHQNSFGGGLGDGFAVKFDNTGSRLWATYYGGSASDWIESCATDANNNLYLVGTTESTANINSGGLINNTGQGYYDAFMVKLDAAGVRQWGSYYGDTGGDLAMSCDISATGELYVSGRTSSTVGIALNGHQGSLGASSEDGFLIKVSTCDPPDPPPFVAADTLVCPNASKVYSVAVLPGVAGYQWTLPPNWSGASITNSINATTGSSGMLKVTVTGTCGSNVSALNVTVTPTPTITIYFSASIYCGGTTATLTATGANTYTWTGGGTSATQTINVQSPTLVEVNGGPTGCSGKQTYALIPDMTAAFNYTVNGMTANFHLVNSSCNTFSWNFGNGNSNTINTDPTTTYPAPGSYTACLSCSGLPEGCQHCITINVPGNTMGGVGVEEIHRGTSVLVYPNPATDRIVIENEADMEITIYNAIGEIVLTRTLQKGRNLMSVESLQNGIYFAKMTNGVEVQKIIVNK